MADAPPSDVSFELDAYNPVTKAVGALQALPRCQSFSGITKTGVRVDATAYGDALKSTTPIDLAEFASITLGFFVEKGAGGGLDADSAVKRIGAPAIGTDYPARTLKVTWAPGLTDELEVQPAERKKEPAKDNNTMVLYTFENVGRTAASHVETGW